MIGGVTLEATSVSVEEACRKLFAETAHVLLAELECRLLMQRRREHMECESRPGLGCLVMGTSTCAHLRRRSRFQRWFRTRLTLELWWVLLALGPVLCLLVAMLELLRSSVL